jgi:hypothetical protein
MLSVEQNSAASADVTQLKYQLHLCLERLRNTVTVVCIFYVGRIPYHTVKCGGSGGLSSGILKLGALGGEVS